MRVMSAAEVRTEGEPARTRPLSAGLWTLFSWLRRDERSASSDSLSSAGSDRTAVSFSFLSPTPSQADALPRPPPAPPTDSYRKRVRDRHLQRQNDRNLTLHRKYGLYYGYDAFSLPPAHKRFANLEDKENRERRATSESLPRRVAHVPGKRRAPQPPGRPHSVVSTGSLIRRYSRKRPAPQPPAKLTAKPEENISLPNPKKVDIMNSKSKLEEKPLSEVNNSTGCKLEKYSKKSGKDSKHRTDKSFLKHIFENKKRNSTLEPVTERILPSISELDKQAAEIIEMCRLKPLEQNNNLSKASSSRGQTWFCTRCLRKYDSTIVTCKYCLPEQKKISTDKGFDYVPSTSSSSTQTKNKIIASSRVSVTEDEKQRLKEILKEMKNSLSKKNKAATENVYKFESSNNSTPSFETPTLRVGSSVPKEEFVNPIQDQSITKRTDESNSKLPVIPNIEKILPKLDGEPATKNIVITQHVVLYAPQNKVTVNDYGDRVGAHNGITEQHNKKERKDSGSNSASDVNKAELHKPLKISSLLNPVYIPKSITTNQESARNIFFSPVESKVQNVQMENTAKSVISAIGSNSEKAAVAKNNESIIEGILKEKLLAKSGEKQSQIKEATHKEKLIAKTTDTAVTTVPPNFNILPAVASTSSDSTDKIKAKQSNMIRFNVEQHSRRRELINLLEQSIAKGDERAAADAAAKLAQLRLSCSVLSFTSQIMAENSKVQPPEQDRSKKTDVAKQKSSTPANKVNAMVQTAAIRISSPSQIKTEEVKTRDNVQNNITGFTSAPVNLGKMANSKENCDKKQELIRPSTSTQVINNSVDNLTTIQVWVEDREATRGPVSLRIPRLAVMGELRRQAETSLGLAGALQRWIVGHTLCTDDNAQLMTLAGPDLSAPFYLCVVEYEKARTTISTNEKKVPEKTNSKTSGNVYSELVKLEQHALVNNTELFECNVCMEECVIGAGAILRDCVHAFCKECLADLVRHGEEPIVSCPAMGCPGVLEEREIRALVTPEEYERWLTRGLKAAESGNRNAFHCRTRDCTGWAFCDPGVRRFPCPVCKHTNCIPCQAIHDGETCLQYQVKSREAATYSDQNDEGTESLLNSLIEKGEALKCPECSAIITKKWGCDWVKCSACKTEICWVTRGRRWGQGGKGDTSGGCRCGVDGKRCHPSCGYCH